MDATRLISALPVRHLALRGGALQMSASVVLVENHLMGGDGAR